MNICNHMIIQPFCDFLHTKQATEFSD